MKMKHFISLVLSCSTLISTAFATPTSLFWTNCTTDTQDPGVANFQSQNYFTLFRGMGKGSSFDPDIGLTYGVASLHDFKLEAGVDYFGGLQNDFFFNSKIGIDEGKLFSWSPSFSLGIFNIGTKHSSNQDVGDFIIGKALPDPIGGRLFVGGFVGKKELGKNRGGVMVGLDRGFYSVKDLAGNEYDKWHLYADYASGKNSIGGGGVALAYYFTPSIYVETGPVWFSDQRANGQWKWAVQLYCGERIFSPSTFSF
jgi:hypothetical protein